MPNFCSYFWSNLSENLSPTCGEQTKKSSQKLAKRSTFSQNTHKNVHFLPEKKTQKVHFNKKKKLPPNLDLATDLLLAPLCILPVKSTALNILIIHVNVLESRIIVHYADNIALYLRSQHRIIFAFEPSME